MNARTVMKLYLSNLRHYQKIHLQVRKKPHITQKHINHPLKSKDTITNPWSGKIIAANNNDRGNKHIRNLIIENYFPME